MNTTATANEPMHVKIFRVGLEWCAEQPGWKRICDIPNVETFYRGWDELSASERRSWINRYHDSAEDAWKEFGRAPCKVPYGFIGTDGIFYCEITDVPVNLNSCQVLRVE